MIVHFFGLREIGRVYHDLLCSLGLNGTLTSFIQHSLALPLLNTIMGQLVKGGHTARLRHREHFDIQYIMEVTHSIRLPIRTPNFQFRLHVKMFLYLLQDFLVAVLEGGPVHSFQHR